MVVRRPSTEIWGEGLFYLRSLDELRELELVQTKFTGSGLRFLTGLKEFRTLKMKFNEVTDARLADIKACPKSKRSVYKKQG